MSQSFKTILFAFTFVTVMLATIQNVNAVCDATDCFSCANGASCGWCATDAVGSRCRVTASGIGASSPFSNCFSSVSSWYYFANSCPNAPTPTAAPTPAPVVTPSSACCVDTGNGVCTGAFSSMTLNGIPYCCPTSFSISIGNNNQCNCGSIQTCSTNTPTTTPSPVRVPTSSPTPTPVIVPSTSSPTPAPVTNVATWAGTYNIQSGCSTSSCCCLTGTITVAQSGTQVTVQGPVTGQCSGTSSTTISFTLTSSTATTATFTSAGNSYQAIRSGNSIQLNNLSFNQCSGSATQTATSDATSSIALTTTSVAMMTISAVLMNAFVMLRN